MQFLEKYMYVMKDIALAIDRLLGDNVLFGEVFLTCSSQHKYDEVETNDLMLMHCMLLLAGVLSGSKTRFDKHLSLDPEVTGTVIASVSHPLFKLRLINLVKAEADGRTGVDKGTYPEILQRVGENGTHI
jgi:hypothetical protein